MARVQLFQGGQIAREGITPARYRPADYGPSPLAEGLKELGRAGSEAAEKIDQVQDVQAKIEANRLSVEHTKLVSGIDKQVRETLGEGAHAAAEQGAQDLENGTADILSRASPRARLLLQSELTTRNVTATDSFMTHGFKEQASALETSSQAKIDNILELASREPDEDHARSLLAPIKEINATRAKFFGYDNAWQLKQDRASVSSFFKARALNMVVGRDGSAYAAIEYATKNRAFLTDEDYRTIVGGYNGAALEEMADNEQENAPLPSSTTATEQNEDGTVTRSLEPKSFFRSWMVPHEGAAYVIDSNGYGVKYGINAKANPGIDVKGLTEDGAYQIFKAKYWDASGADKLPPALAAIHADTYYMNSTKAKQFLRDSGGDPDKYMDLRENFLQGLVNGDQAKYGRYEKAWNNRNRDLRHFATRQGGNGTFVPFDPSSNVEDYRRKTMARTDIGAAYKHVLISRAEARAGDFRQNKSIIESEAAGKLAMAAAQLGDRFTSIKDLPQDAWAVASDTTKAQMIASAKTNKENKPLKPEVAAQIGFLRTFRPQSLADPKVLAMLGSKGVPQKMISELAQEGGRALGTISGAKADHVERSTLEALARPAFEARGIRLWDTQAKKGTAAYVAEQKEDAARSLQLMNYLEIESTAWALANPGKKADTKTMQSWIARAMVSTSATGHTFGTLSDEDVAKSYGQRNVDAVKAKLRSVGIDPSNENVADYLRRVWMRSPHIKP